MGLTPIIPFIFSRALPTTLLKRKFGGELKDARIVCTLNLSEAGRTQVRNRIVEIRVIQNIEEFEAQLESHAFTDSKKSC
jgi:hypothetical protein